jgi:hypothetical protein
VAYESLVAKHGDEFWLDEHCTILVENAEEEQSALEVRLEDAEEIEDVEEVEEVEDWYDSAGQLVSRTIDTQENGVLFSLNDVGQIFERDEASYSGLGFSDLDPPDFPSIQRYPLAGTHGLGNIQADGLPTALDAGIARLSRALISLNDTSIGKDEAISYAENPGPLRSGGFNGYARISHVVRPTARSHDVTQGRITRSLLGTYALTAADKAKAEKAKDALVHGLPHQQTRTLLLDPDAPRDLRIEGVVHIDLRRIPKVAKSGR